VVKLAVAIPVSASPGFDSRPMQISFLYLFRCGGFFLCCVVLSSESDKISEVAEQRLRHTTTPALRFRAPPSLFGCTRPHRGDACMVIMRFCCSLDPLHCVFLSPSCAELCIKLPRQPCASPLEWGCESVRCDSSLQSLQSCDQRLARVFIFS
jgi:hypothetical protein